MNQRVDEAGKASVPSTPYPLRLASRLDLPPRTRALAEATFAIARRYTNDTLARALEEFQRELVKLSENARDTNQQQNYFQSTRALFGLHGHLAPRYVEDLEDSFATYDRRAHSGTSIVPSRETLSLVEANELEESLAVQEFVARNEVHYSQALYELGHRFAVLVALPMLEPQAIPAGPGSIARALRHAATVLTIPTEHRVLFFHTFGRHASKDLAALYEALNACFVEHRILANLRAPAVRIRRQRAAPAPAPGETPPQPAAAPAQAKAEPAPPPAARARHGGISLADARDLDLFASLRELLAGSRSGREAIAAANAAPPDSYVPSDADVQGVLGALQAKPSSSHLPGGRELRSVTQLKHELLQNLAELAPTGQTPRLSAEDSDTIDLVGMLFDNMSSSLPRSSGTGALLTRLQVPLMRIALRDKSFFTRNGHPARLLLNALAETGERWMDGSDPGADQDLHDKLQVMLDRLGAEFDGDLGQIEDVLGDLSDLSQTLTRKAEVTERRQVDAAIGREKLALAREAAAQAVSARLAEKMPGQFVRTLLEQAWSDVLALTLLRQGEASEAYKKRIEIAEKLIEANPGARGSENAPPLPEEMREEVESGLSQIGYHPADVQALAKHLFIPEAAANDDEIPSRTELASKLQRKARLGDDAQQDERPLEAAARRRAEMNLNEDELATFAEVSELPFGTWIEFVTNQQGDRVRKKIAWFSKLTGRCVFVNQRGQRMGDTTLEELARDIVRGQAKIFKPASENFVDRAWNKILSSFKQLGSIAAMFAPPPAEPL
jgi:hypothetical protein